MHKRLQIYKFVCKQIILNSKAKNKIIIVEWCSKISIKLLNDYIPSKIILKSEIAGGKSCMQAVEFVFAID